MPVSKRLRFEILRRDEFRCHYCGVRGPETENGLVVDHVIAVALGGTDTADNLVAACFDCNSGKGSTGVSEEIVGDIQDMRAEREAARVERAGLAEEQLAQWRSYQDMVYDAWVANAPSYAPIPDDIDQIVGHWYREHVPHSIIDYAFEVAWAAQGVSKRNRLRYAIGVVRNALAEVDRAPN